MMQGINNKRLFTLICVIKIKTIYITLLPQMSRSLKSHKMWELYNFCIIEPKSVTGSQSTAIHVTEFVNLPDVDQWTVRTEL